MSTTFIALGTNMGNRIDNLKTAIDCLNAENIFVQEHSRVYETAPMYVEDQPRFLNMVVKADTSLNASELLSALKKLESEIGRVPSEVNGPRLIDLDILYLEDIIVDMPHLKIPHISIAERQFVLQPLHDIAPEWQDVRSGKSVVTMLESLQKDPTLVPVGDCLDTVKVA